ncbi:MAG: hypothetical protein COZ70_07585 [Deltaproteobacteria bacterium CG_4_8_14_3_um_filter_51_11]|nr:MAG: hypothetical protein AUK25_15400 [Desulfobacteraceae bacterium CG2_30_51_40]PIP46828.1 MAG: hypothetical protein COX16_07735 [Deltaproteobacteria bacterium CG23_combo_of_CG06-09_8_20_14_all_51_20]PIW01913.1 MAG: hypothetical protein COW41_01380 [Deltaproteobacteria bacterium CG17_big_fil_post_rev_8_21_14_2_50_51_6]PIX19689.1 MAG: hypothetical protein COZ70_07585 [Deltaproteobacteria bacterium CG_4_8_14_3_um_filter_51_11]PIY23879.1 MAG: hypothetical protein COZ11_08710 [Deltaproteobacter
MYSFTVKISSLNLGAGSRRQGSGGIKKGLFSHLWEREFSCSGVTKYCCNERLVKIISRLELDETISFTDGH